MKTADTKRIADMIPLAEIRAAAERIAHIVRVTPMLPCERVCDIAGVPVYLKLENLQHTGAFKIRGAANCIAQLRDRERAAGVITASAGNHSQGVAAAATALGLTADIYMPCNTPFLKIQRTRHFGGIVHLQGDCFDDAYCEACDVQQQSGRCFVHPYADERVMAGQGTIGLEILDQLPEAAAAVIPVGGGGLAAGVASALRAIKPDMAIFGVQARNAPSMAEAFRSGRVETVPGRPTIAEGIAVGSAHPLTYGLLSELLDDIVTVDEGAIATAMLDLIENDNLVAEGAGAVALAALPQLIGRLDGPTVLLISGGNVDVTTLGAVIDRGLAVEQRSVRLLVVLPDIPGALARLAGVIGDAGANIIEILHNRLTGEVEVGRAEVEIVLLTRGPEHVADILAQLRSSGYEARRHAHA
ncbi:MAG: threonine ammonia-lyase [candidate division WS1 bacterium]|nr:threonine ammonia-lyase [candidate division WS1 bacterium]